MENAGAGSYSGRFKCAEGWFTIHCYNANDGGYSSGYVAAISSNDAYIFRVKAGADAVLKKLGSVEVTETEVSEWAAGITDHTRTWDESSKIPSGHKLIGINNFSANASNSNLVAQKTTGASFTISGNSVKVTWDGSSSDVPYINGGWSGILITIPE